MTDKINVTVRSIDGSRSSRNFRKLAAARRFAQRAVGAHPDLGCDYAVSFDGICTVTCRNATLADLFPEEVAPAKAPVLTDWPADAVNDEYEGDDAPDPDEAHERWLETRYAGMDEAEAIAHGRLEDL